MNSSRTARGRNNRDDDSVEACMIGHHSDVRAADASTQGRLIRGARLYDLMVNVMTLGRASVLREQAIDLAAIQPDQSVLEVGCGTGEVAQRARARVGASGKVSGIDPSAEMIAVARDKAARRGLDIDYRVAVIEALPFPDASFDVVLSSLMMHHLPDDLKAAGLREVRRVLKPGGRVVILDLKRARGLLSHLVLLGACHMHMSQGVEDLSPLLSEAGFVHLRIGKTRFFPVGFVSGVTPV